MSTVLITLPKYQCHKQVNAAKITQVDDLKKAGAGLHTAENPGTPIGVTQEWFEKHRPHVGGYYVLYEDGYASFSPAAAFEDGYTRVTE